MHIRTYPPWGSFDMFLLLTKGKGKFVKIGEVKINNLSSLNRTINTHVM